MPCHGMPGHCRKHLCPPRGMLALSQKLARFGLLLPHRALPQHPPLPSVQSMLVTRTSSPTSTRCLIFFSSDRTTHLRSALERCSLTADDWKASACIGLQNCAAQCSREQLYFSAESRDAQQLAPRRVTPSRRAFDRLDPHTHEIGLRHHHLCRARQRTRWSARRLGSHECQQMILGCQVCMARRECGHAKSAEGWGRGVCSRRVTRSYLACCVCCDEMIGKLFRNGSAGGGVRLCRCARGCSQSEPWFCYLRFVRRGHHGDSGHPQPACASQSTAHTAA